MDKYLLVSQGEVFYVTEMLARLEGMQRGPAGNTSLTAAISLARELPEDAIVVVQETEYTGAGKLPSAQLSFAIENGVVLINPESGSSFQKNPNKSVRESYHLTNYANLI